MFRVGQKVVCIVDFAAMTAPYELSGPTKGQICTVRDLEHRGEVPSIRIMEIINPPRMCSNGVFCEPSFASESFRPLVEKRTDISFAHEILRKATKRERV